MSDNEIIKKIFGSNTRIKLFDLFLNNKDHVYYVREISRTIDEQINSVRRELKNLHQISFINKKEEDRKIFYYINKEFTFYDSLDQMFNNDYISKVKQINEKNELDWHSTISPIIRNLELVIVDGVFNKKDNSQLDLLLVGDNTGQCISNWASQFEKKLKKEIKYAVISYNDYQYRVKLKDKFITSIIDNGKIIYKIGDKK